MTPAAVIRCAVTSGVLLTVGLCASRSIAAVQPIERSVVFATNGNTPLELDAYIPAHRAQAVIVVIHGGGWTAGSAASVAPYARRFAALGLVGIAIDYPLAPPPTAASAPRGLLEALRWIETHRRPLHLATARVGLLGISAGAQLALVAAEAPAVAGVHIAAVATWSAPTDLTSLYRESRNRYVRRSLVAFLGCDPDTCPEDYARASPARHAHANEPPTLLLTSAAELIPLTQAELMKAALRAAHDSVTLDVLPGTRHAAAYARTAWRPTARFLCRALRAC